MKLQATATTAVFPAALVAASIALAVLLLPGAAVPARSSGVAPALKLVAGEVVAAVQAPVRAVTRASRSEHAAASGARQSVTPASPQQQSASAPKRIAPAHHAHADRHRVPQPHAVTRKPVTTHLAPPAPPSPVTAHGNGKAKAWGRLKKLVPKATPALTGHGKARGHSADAPHGPPAVPPGLATRDSGVDEHAAPRGHGGAR